MEFRTVSAAVAMACLLSGVTAATSSFEMTQTSSEIERTILETLQDERDLRRLTVSVVGTEATLGGPVPHLYAKNHAIELALGADGIDTVVSEIELPEPESDDDIVEQVVQVVRRYPFYTMWDHVDGRVNQGIVTLQGSVTSDRDKKGDLYEEIAKIPGVQDYVDNITVQSPSSGDRRLRAEIARRLFRSEHFERFAGMTNPPFHIVVDRSIVTLVGYVPSEIEYREMERIIAQMNGVLRVDNQLVVLR